MYFKITARLLPSASGMEIGSCSEQSCSVLPPVARKAPFIQRKPDFPPARNPGSLRCLYTNVHLNSSLHILTCKSTQKLQKMINSHFVQRSAAKESHNLPTAMQYLLLNTGSKYPIPNPSWQHSCQHPESTQKSPNTNRWACVCIIH